MSWTIRYLKSVRKTINKLDPESQNRIYNYLEERVKSLDNPRKLGEPLKGRLANFWRYRVGDYRIVCELREEELVVLVVRIGHRSKVYR